MVYSILYQYDRTGLAPGWITILKICWKVRLFTNEKFRYSKTEWWKGSLQFLKWISLLKMISNEGDSTTHMLIYWFFSLSYIESQNVYRWHRFFCWRIKFWKPKSISQLYTVLSHLMLEMSKIKHENRTCNDYISTKDANIFWKVT